MNTTIMLFIWISDWLGYFEIWLITDEWYGGGHSYDDSKKD